MTTTSHSVEADYDAIVIGAGFSGLYILKRLRDLGLSARLYEAGSGVGGAWYWNRYPGARTDSDSMIYCFSEWFDEDLVREWGWRERYSSQPELERYFNWVADRLDLRRDIDFDTRLRSAVYDEQAALWTLTTEQGSVATARYFIPAVGALSDPNVPDFPGLADFQGPCHHSAQFPKDGIDFAGKRVAVIGNGATGVQIVPEVAKTADSVRHFIRNPCHLVPGRNHVLAEADVEATKEAITEILGYSRNTFGGFPYDFLGTALDTSPAERQAAYQKSWEQGGFTFLFLFADVLASREANDTTMDFLREKIRTLVRDPATAGLVTPTDPWLTKRPPLEHGYYSALNRDNVHVVDIKANPVDAVTSNAIRLADGTEHEADVILLATGFDSYTGSLSKIAIRGRDELPLTARWADRPRNHLGLMSAKFPNMFMLYCGPYNPAPFTNGPTLIEQQAEWILDWIQYLDANGHVAMEPTEAAEEEFFALHSEIANSTLIPETSSWWTRAAGADEPRLVMSWAGGFPEYRRLCDVNAAGKTDHFVLR
ncbi:flavin-containing monooxygenase [Amycolatopsis sp. VS8301801F10]|uniref:flavin-containing monooxygenase n=1 Tax=Amycolatopsis sp. VS8301801F10 TaxID=2652442 RepID=UPI0038FD2D1F